MNQENKEFYDLLNELIKEQTFDLELVNGNVVKCKQLTTAQLKEFIKSVVDSPLTQTNFNSAATTIFNESVSLLSGYVPTTVDRLLFLIETRIKSICPTMTVNFEGKEKTIDFVKVKQTLSAAIKENKDLFQEQEVAEEGITLKFGVPTLTTESQLNEEIYKDLEVDVNNPDEVRKMLGEAFVNEIAKTFKEIKIQEKTLVLSTVSFKTRLQTIESLPAALIQKVVNYIEKYKQIVDNSLIFEEYVIPIDGSLFSIR